MANLLLMREAPTIRPLTAQARRAVDEYGFEPDQVRITAKDNFGGPRVYVVMRRRGEKPWHWWGVLLDQVKPRDVVHFDGALILGGTADEVAGRLKALRDRKAIPLDMTTGEHIDTADRILAMTASVKGLLGQAKHKLMVKGKRRTGNWGGRKQQWTDAEIQKALRYYAAPAPMSIRERAKRASAALERPVAQSSLRRWGKASGRKQGPSAVHRTTKRRRK